MASVRELQTALNHFSTALPRLVVDGVVGTKTVARLREFQQMFGLSVSGVADLVTLRALGLSGTISAGVSTLSPQWIATQNLAVTQAITAAAMAARMMAEQGATQPTITAAARAAAQGAWSSVTGSAEGYSAKEPDIFGQALELMLGVATNNAALGPLGQLGDPEAEAQTLSAARNALSNVAGTAGVLGLGGLLGGGTVLLIGGALLLLVMLKR